MRQILFIVKQVRAVLRTFWAERFTKCAAQAALEKVPQA
jgi:hypothetical protein